MPVFSLTPGQDAANRVLAGPQRHTLIYGGARSGKTFLLVRGLVIRALRAPDSRHVIFRQKANAVRTSVWLDTYPKVLRTCFPGVTSQSQRQDGYEKLPNGSEIWFGGLDEKDRVEKILGMEFSTIYMNETSQISYSSYTVAKTRLAQVVPGLKQRLWADLNPVGTAHWTYREFVLGVDPVTKRELPDRGDYAIATLNPTDNAANLSPEFLRSLQNLPERQRKRFFEGAFASEVDGALWTLETIERDRVDTGSDRLPDMARVVVAIDPSGTSGDEAKRSDAVGIVVAGVGIDGRAYVLEDLTCNLPPAAWARRAIDAFHRHRADRIVAEGNFGGAMVEAVLQTADPLAPVSLVTASRGKSVRAEPVAALYEQGRVSHVGVHPDLEDEMLNFTTSGYVGSRSPNRADALVWALTNLMVASPERSMVDFL
jgi:predicted phage terminase large subunit-like protein